MTDIKLEELRKKYATIVAKIIDEGFAKKRSEGDPEQLLDQWVCSQIKKRIHLPEIYNAAIRAGTDTDCGITNVDEGAKAIVRDAVKTLPFDIDGDGLISPRNERLSDLGRKAKTLDNNLRIQNNSHEQLLKDLYKAKEANSNAVNVLFVVLDEDGIKDHEARRGRVLSLLNELITDLPTV